MSNPNNFKEKRFDQEDFDDDVCTYAKELFQRWVSECTPSPMVPKLIKQSLLVAELFQRTLVDKGKKSYMRSRFCKQDELFADVPWLSDEREADREGEECEPTITLSPSVAETLGLVGDEMGDTTEEIETSIKKIEEDIAEEDDDDYYGN